MGISENSTVVLVSRRVMLFAVPLLALLVGVGPMVSASAEDKEPATTAEVKTKQEAGGAGSHEEKTAATEHLAAAKEELARKVETANREGAKETEKVVAASSAAGAAPTAPVAEGAPAAGAVLTSSTPVANDQEVMRRAVETAQKKSKKTGGEEAVEKTAAVAEKDASVTEEVKSLAEVTPDAAGKALGSGSDTGVSSADAVTEASQKARSAISRAAY